MEPRAFNPDGDLPAVAELLGRTRAAGELSHPGGIQWWLREVGREGFEAFVWEFDGGALCAFALIDGDFVVPESDRRGPSRLDVIDWSAEHLREAGVGSI